MDHQLDVIDRTVAKTYEWLHQGEGTMGHLISVLPSDFAVLM